MRKSFWTTAGLRLFELVLILNDFCINDEIRSVELGTLIDTVSTEVWCVFNEVWVVFGYSVKKFLIFFKVSVPISHTISMKYLNETAFETKFRLFENVWCSAAFNKKLCPRNLILWIALVLVMYFAEINRLNATRVY